MEPKVHLSPFRVKLDGGYGIRSMVIGQFCQNKHSGKTEVLSLEKWMSNGTVAVTQFWLLLRLEYKLNIDSQDHSISLYFHVQIHSRLHIIGLKLF